MRYREITEAPAIRRPTPPSGTKPPLSPEQTRRASERKATVARQMRDEDMRHNAKVGDLRDKLNQGS